MDKIGAILNSVGTLIIAIGVVVVLLKAGGLIAALAERLGPEKADAEGAEGEPKEEQET